MGFGIGIGYREEIADPLLVVCKLRDNPKVNKQILFTDEYVNKCHMRTFNNAFMVKSLE